MLTHSTYCRASESRGTVTNGETSHAWRLRFVHASEYARRVPNGWYLDDTQSETVQPIVYRLPRGRGYVAGCTYGDGMVTYLDASAVWRDPAQAARDADALAERFADDERDYRASHCACGNAKPCADCWRDEIASALPDSPHLSVRVSRDDEPGRVALLAACPRTADDALGALWRVAHVVAVRPDPSGPVTVYLA